MIDLYYWTTPNGYKILMALEELGLPYRKHAIDIGKGEQFAPEFLAISPNNKIPAIVDHDQSLPIFESGAILLHLAEKTGRLLPEDPLDRSTALQWLFWQMGGLGPMLGQYFHFANSAENIPYAIDRYKNESLRLLGVLETQLNNRGFLAGEYSIADIASYPWVLAAAGLNIDLAEFPNTNRWLKSIRGRPTTVAAYGITTTHEEIDTDSQAA
jgi:GST-like protein